MGRKVRRLADMCASKYNICGSDTNIPVVASATDVDLCCMAFSFVQCTSQCDMCHKHAGSLVTTALHVFSIMVGPGVLALPSAASWLGWVFGPILLTLFYLICLLVSSMLVSVYEVRRNV